jgi:hypothetical protein
MRNWVSRGNIDVGANFQFLNIAGGGKPFRTTIFDRKTRNCFSFTLPLDPNDSEKKKRSQARDLSICNEIADRMRAEGFGVGKAGRGKPWGAVLTFSVSKFKVMVMLDAKRLPRTVKCDVRTWTHTSRWRPVPSKVVENGWSHTLKALEKVLRQDLRAESLTRGSEDGLAGPARTERCRANS